MLGNHQCFLTVLIILTLSMITGGCSLLPQKGDHQTKLATLKHWQINGKLSISHPKNNVTGYLTWKQNKTDFDLYIAGPLAQGATRIKGGSKQISLLLPGWKAPQTADSATVLMQKHLGWSFPIDDLRYWIKGMQSPRQSSKNVHYSKDGLLESLHQDGWRISLSRYQYQSGYWLPSRIKVLGKQYRLVLAIKKWTLYD